MAKRRLEQVEVIVPTDTDTKQRLVDIWTNAVNSTDRELVRKQTKDTLRTAELPNETDLDDVADEVCKRTGNTIDPKVYREVVETLQNIVNEVADKRFVTES